MTELNWYSRDEPSDGPSGCPCPTPRDIHMWYLARPKGLCRCDSIKGFEKERLSWIIRVGSSREYQFSSVTQSCPTLCDPIDCSMPGFLVHHQFPELLKLMPIESVMPSNHFILCDPFSSCLQSFPRSGSFPMSQCFTSGGQSIGVSAIASVLPMNIQD